MNPARPPIVAGNWKMNAGGPEACELAKGVTKSLKKLGKDRRDLVEVVIGPPFTALAAVVHELTQSDSPVTVSGQNMHFEAEGAFTGEVSASMLLDAGASWVIIGHSERRQHFGETDEIVAKKVETAVAAGLKPIVCVGETLAEREAEETLAVVERQVRAVLDLFAAKPGYGVLAYEPIWAIGTGKVAEPEDAQQVHAMIRNLLAGADPAVANGTRILYGGSVKPDNAAGLFSQEDIDGGLVGGASLKADGFGKIIAAAAKLAEPAETS